MVEKQKDVLAPRPITWDRDGGVFVILESDADVQACNEAEWPVVRWNEKLRCYEQLSCDNEWVDLTAGVLLL